MGLSGKDYDRFNPDYTPNKDRRMAEWREKKKKQKKDSDEAHRKRLGEIASDIARKEAEKEERRELKGPVQSTPITSQPSVAPSAPVPPGAKFVKPRRSRRQQFARDHWPTLFDGVE